MPFIVLSGPSLPDDCSSRDSKRRGGLAMAPNKPSYDVPLDILSDCG